MKRNDFVLEQFKKTEDAPDATEDMLLDYISDLLTNSATNKEEAYEVLVDYLDYLGVDPDSLVIKNQEETFEVDFSN